MCYNDAQGGVFMYTVYCHLFPNGKRYIGITRNTPQRRFGQGKNYATCTLVSRAIQKYGWDSIEHINLDAANDKKSAEDKERHYIAIYRTNDPEHGYNILPGGDVSNNCATPEMRYRLGNGQRGRARSEEEKRKIGEGVRKTFQRPERNGHVGMKMSAETKARMSQSQKAAWDDARRNAAAESMRERMSDPEYRERVLSSMAQYRRKTGEWNMPETAKEKLSKRFKGKWMGANSPCSKPVLQYTKDGGFVRRWDNAVEAERSGIALRSNIGKCCRHPDKYHTAGGYVWRFDD